MNFTKKYKWLVPSLTFSTAMIVCRVVHTGNLTFAFLLWNLFLAVLPMYFSYKMSYAGSKLTGWVYAALWLLFFPNAMYITTDLFHLHERGDIPLWFDLLLLLSAAVNGVILGFISLYRMEQWMVGFIPRRYIALIIFSLLILCGYGIYLGRYERWNSWDIVASPVSLLYDVGYHFIHPYRNRDIWILSGAFGTWMYIMYRYVIRIKVSV